MQPFPAALAPNHLAIAPSPPGRYLIDCEHPLSAKASRFVEFRWCCFGPTPSLGCAPSDAELSNKLKVLVIHDDTTDKAAAALNVNIGASHDPEAFPGLAHFCEHMLFLGTEKYVTQRRLSTSRRHRLQLPQCLSPTGSAHTQRSVAPTESEGGVSHLFTPSAAGCSTDVQPHSYACGRTHLTPLGTPSRTSTANTCPSTPARRTRTRWPRTPCTTLTSGGNTSMVFWAWTRF